MKTAAYGLQRPVDPLGHLRDNLVRDPGNRFLRNARTIDLIKMRGDLTGRQTFGIERQDHLRPGPVTHIRGLATIRGPVFLMP